jgi:hypothetical protein
LHDDVGEGLAAASVDDGAADLGGLTVQGGGGQAAENDWSHSGITPDDDSSQPC